MPALAGDATQVISRPPSHTAVLPPAEEPQGSGRKVWLGVLIGLLLFALLAGGGYLLVSSLTGDDPNAPSPLVTIDDYADKRFSEAQGEIEALQLGVERINEQTEDPTKIGRVIAQDPAPGTQLTRGEGSVTLTVGIAPPQVVVPDLAGMTVSEAQVELEENDLLLGSVIPESSSEFEEDDVTRSDPLSGDEVDPGTEVDVYVSTGPALVIVPDVSSDCLSRGGANKILRDADLELAGRRAAAVEPRVFQRQPDRRAGSARRRGGPRRNRGDGLPRWRWRRLTRGVA